MKEPYLEVTFRQGRPIAAYLYLPRRPEEKSYLTSTAEPGLVIDFNRNEKPIGIEITAPTKVTAAALNKVLRSVRPHLIWVLCRAVPVHLEKRKTRISQLETVTRRVALE